MRILVTGGAGYIGSHVCKHLAAHEHMPIVYDNLSRGHAQAVRWGPLVTGDILDGVQLRAAIREHRPQAIIHLASLCYVGESDEDPALYYNNNVVGSLTLFDAARELGVRTVVFSSSCAVYGSPDVIPIDETAVPDPINPYGKTKLAVEYALTDFSRAYGINFAALRYFNACGADPDAEIGEEHDPETHLIPRALMAAGGEIPFLDVYGDDYDTPDGTCIRDYIHVSDLAAAHADAVTYLTSGGGNATLNLGSGVGFSIKDIVSTVERITRRRVPIRITPRRAGDPPQLIANAESARKTIGFEAKFSTLDTIIDTAWRYYCRLTNPDSVKRDR